MTEKDRINDVYEQIKPSVNLINRTSELMKQELKKEDVKMDKDKKIIRLGRYTKQIAVAACLVIVIASGITIFNNNYETTPQIDGPMAKKKIQSDKDFKPPAINKKVAVNITGIVEEVSDDGKKFKINNKWIKINDDTIFDDDPDNGTQTISRVINTGNYISGWTSEDIDTMDEVTAKVIYQNIKTDE